MKQTYNSYNYVPLPLENIAEPTLKGIDSLRLGDSFGMYTLNNSSYLRRYISQKSKFLGYPVYLKELSPEEIEDAQFKQVSSLKTLEKTVCNIKNCTK